MRDIALNSYDVSFIIKVFKPHWNVGMEKDELRSILGFQRCESLISWASANVDHEKPVWHGC
jgi:hypothetical protein